MSDSYDGSVFLTKAPNELFVVFLRGVPVSFAKTK